MSLYSCLTHTEGTTQVAELQKWWHSYYSLVTNLWQCALSWQLYSAASVGHQSHYPDTELTSPCPILIMSNTRLVSDKYPFESHWFDSTRVQTLWGLDWNPPGSDSQISQNGRRALSRHPTGDLHNMSRCLQLGFTLLHLVSIHTSL